MAETENWDEDGRNIYLKVPVTSVAKAGTHKTIVNFDRGTVSSFGSGKKRKIVSA